MHDGGCRVGEAQVTKQNTQKLQRSTFRRVSDWGILGQSPKLNSSQNGVIISINTEVGKTTFPPRRNAIRQWMHTGMAKVLETYLRYHWSQVEPRCILKSDCYYVCISPALEV
jgi:hypothetical protein